MLVHGRAERLVAHLPAASSAASQGSDETLAPGLGDLQATVGGDKAREAERAAEAAWHAERLGDEHGQVLDVRGAPYGGDGDLDAAPGLELVDGTARALGRDR